VVISCHQKLNFDYLLEKIWENLGLVRIYTKKKGNTKIKSLIMSEYTDLKSLRLANSK